MADRDPYTAPWDGWPGAGRASDLPDRFRRENDEITREREGDVRSGTLRVTYMDRRWHELIFDMWRRLRAGEKLRGRGPWWQTPIGWALTGWIVWRVRNG